MAQEEKIIRGQHRISSKHIIITILVAVMVKCVGNYFNMGDSLLLGTYFTALFTLIFIAIFEWRRFYRGINLWKMLSLISIMSAIGMVAYGITSLGEDKFIGVITIIIGAILFIFGIASLIYWRKLVRVVHAEANVERTRNKMI